MQILATVLYCFGSVMLILAYWYTRRLKSPQTGDEMQPDRDKAESWLSIVCLIFVASIVVGYIELLGLGSDSSSIVLLLDICNVVPIVIIGKRIRKYDVAQQ